MKRVRDLLIGGAVAALPLSLSLTLGAASPVSAEGSFDGLTECVAEQRALAALFLVDTSASLRRTDPNGARVPALQSAVTAFETLRSSAGGSGSVPVYIDFLDFGTRTVRSFPDLPEWQELPDEVSEVTDLLTVFGQRSGSEDTDYVGALEPWFDREDPDRPRAEIGAIELLERAPENACQLLVWFTDGKLDLDFQEDRKQFNWAREPIVLRSPRDEAPANAAAAEALCDAGGVIDSLRQKQDNRLYAPFTAVVALDAGGSGPTDFSLMQRMALGESDGERCGSREANGVFLLATELPQLVGQLRRAVLGPPKAETDEIGTCLAGEVGPDGTVECEYPFFVAESLTSFNLITTSSGRGVDVSLIDPSGAVLALPSEGLVQNSVGASLEITRPLDEVLLIDARLPTSRSDWAGEWRVRYTTADPAVAERIRNSAAIYMFGSLEARLRGGAELIRGREGRFRVELVSADNTPRGPLAFGEGSRIIVSVDGVALPQPEISPDGSFEYRYTVPEDDESDQLPISVELRPQFVINDETPPIPLDGFEAPLGFVSVKPPPRFPVVEFLTSGDLPVLDEENPIAVGEIKVDATSTPESGGCVELQDVRMEYPASMDRFESPPAFEVLLNGSPLERGAPCALELGSGEVEFLELRIEFEPEELRIPKSQLRSEILFLSTSAIDPSETDTYRGEVVVVIDSKPPPDVGMAVWLMALGIAVPMALMYAVNILYSARFQLPDGAMRVSIPVIYQGGQLYRNENGRPARMVLRDEDMGISGIDRKWARRQEVGSFLFSIRPSFSPVGAPVSSVEESSSNFVMSRHGSRRGKGKPGSNLTNGWALAVQPQDLIGAGLDPEGEPRAEGDLDPLHATFLALVPSGPSAERVFSEIVADAERQGPLVLEPAVAKAAQSDAKARAAAKPPIGPGQGTITKDPPLPSDVLPPGSVSTPTLPELPDDDLPGSPIQLGSVVEPERGLRRLFKRRSKAQIQVGPLDRDVQELP